MKDVSRFNDGVVAIRGRGYIQYLEAVSVVHADVAPDDPAVGDQVMREKPVATVPKIFKNTQTNPNKRHEQPLL
ncbi:MAG: hypothetical protein QXM53_08935 [Thermofilaceae archaeon]